jgi:cell division protein FtsL
MMRLLNVLVIAALVLAAADVYKIKFESTRQAQRVAKLRMEIRRENDAIAALRAEWSKLDNPARIQALARRHLPLKPVEGHQFDRLDQLPERPPELVPVDDPDPIGTVLANPRLIDRTATGSLPAQSPTSPRSTPSVPPRSSTTMPARAATGVPGWGPTTGWETMPTQMPTRPSHE